MKYIVRSYCLSEKIDLQALEKKIEANSKWTCLRKTRTHLIYKIEENRFLHVYFFGVLVFVNFEVKAEKEIIKQLKEIFFKPIDKDKIESEEYIVLEEEDIEKDLVGFEEVKIKKLDIDRQEIITSILAQSTAIDHVEKLVDKMLIGFEKINLNLAKTGELKVKSKQVSKIIGVNNNILNFVFSKLSLLDKPDILWEKEKLGFLFQEMYSMFELDSRFKSLKLKINFIQENSKFILQVLSNHRADVLEIIIMILIAVEVIIMCF